MKPTEKFYDKLFTSLKAAKKTSETKYFLDKLFSNVVDNDKKRPEKASHHVGIEVECYSKVRNTTEMLRAIYTHDLEDYINVGEDASIRPERGYVGYELRMLIPEKELDTVFPKIANLFKVLKLRVNKTCGLHVHLDMRNRNKARCYANLLKSQDILFGMVDKQRWNNKYCAYTTDFNGKERRCAINGLAYREHKTLEVRLHHGTVNTAKILNWIKLLVGVVNLRSVPKIESKKDVLKCKFSSETMAYLNKSFSPAWLKTKPRVLKRIEKQKLMHDLREAAELERRRLRREEWHRIVNGGDL